MMFNELPNIFETDIQRLNIKGQVSAIKTVYYGFGHYYNEKEYIKSSKTSTFEIFSKEGFLLSKTEEDHSTDILKKLSKLYLKDAKGRLATIEYRNESGEFDTRYNFAYGEPGILRCRAEFQNESSDFDITLRYSNNRRLLSAQDQFHEYHFIYDQLGRIIRSKGDYDEEFDYDEFGNVLSHSIDYCNGSAEEQSFAYTHNYEYKYDDENQWEKATLTDSLVDGRKFEIYRHIFYY